jgi:hypothetical protein
LPEALSLEDRQLLSALVTGNDSKGDSWTLRLIGPGTIDVEKQPDSSGKPAPLLSNTDINTITIAGTDPTKSRLIGYDVKGPNSDGRVFFQTMTALPARSDKFTGVGLGLVAINMPNFWLANTTKGGAVNGGTIASIALPDGVDTLRFGGVDTMQNQPATLPNTASDDKATVILGLPMFGGTRIIIDKSISSTQQSQASGSTPGKTVNHAVDWSVSGRLDLFQANEIVGDAKNPPGQFTHENSAAAGAGGTFVDSAVAGTANLFEGIVVKGSVTGQIGDIRIGGDATNFTTLVNDATGSGNDRISNFSVGGETTNVMVIAPNGTRNLVFGKGMDTVEVLTHVVNTIKANRGAINSRVTVDRSISRIDIGGDVVDTTIQSGVSQNYTTIFNNVTGTSTSIFASSTPSAPPEPIGAQVGGGMEVHVAGDVNNSVFAASVQPFNDTSVTPSKLVFGGPNQLVLPNGHITAKVEGKINNATATPATPTQAFFAQHVDLLAGPVIPPAVPEPPYTGPQQPAMAPGIHDFGRFTVTAAPKTTTTAAAAASVHAASVPHTPTAPAKPTAATSKNTAPISHTPVAAAKTTAATPKKPNTPATKK